jgi:hypothetical protein
MMWAEEDNGASERASAARWLAASSIVAAHKNESTQLVQSRLIQIFHFFVYNALKDNGMQEIWYFNIFYTYKIVF